jgi:sulfatase modifying factor 1
MMVSLRRSSLCLTLVSSFSLLACNDDPKEGDSASDTGTEDEIGDDTTTGDGDTTESGSTDATESESTDATDDMTDTVDTSDTLDTSDTSESTDATDTDTGDTTDTTDTDTTDTDTTDSDTETTGDGDGDCAGICGTENCGDCPENGAVAIPGNYSIGATEVRNGDYQAFLDVDFTSEFLDGWLPAECSWKTDFTPDDWPANPEADLPVNGVDWCDAWAYCEWSGQHMCGRIGGGAVSLADVQNLMTSEWYKACTGGGVKNYPYALNYMAAACNGLDAGIGELTPIGSLMTCVGGYAGIFDMSGNVWEWENSCDTDPQVPSETQECRQRGGSFYSDGPTLRCGVASVRARNYRNDNLGIRCCDMP